jgi:hypothetical protein
MAADAGNAFHSASFPADCAEFTKRDLLPTALSWDRLAASTRDIAEEAMTFLDNKCAAEEKARGPRSVRDCDSARPGVASAPKLATSRDSNVAGYSETDALQQWTGSTPLLSRNAADEMLRAAGAATGAVKSGPEWHGSTPSLLSRNAADEMLGTNLSRGAAAGAVKSGLEWHSSTPSFLSRNAANEMLGTNVSGAAAKSGLEWQGTTPSLPSRSGSWEMTSTLAAGAAAGAVKSGLEWQGTTPSLVSGEMVSTLAVDGSPTSGHRPPPPMHRSRSYLTEASAITIFLAKRSEKGQRSSLGSRLADDFGITSKAVRDIWKMRTWRKTTEPFWNAEERQRAAATRPGKTQQ